MFTVHIEPTIVRVSSGFSGTIWLDTKIMLEKITIEHYYQHRTYCFHSIEFYKLRIST